MKYHGLLFQGDMIRAFLANRKKETRRVLKRRDGGSMEGLVYLHMLYRGEDQFAVFLDEKNGGKPVEIRCPLGGLIRRWYAKETWRTYKSLDDVPPRELAEGVGIKYECDGDTNVQDWRDGLRQSVGRVRQSIFMRRWMSRIGGPVGYSKVQHLQEIDAWSAVNEGIEPVAQLGVLRACGWRDYSGRTDGFLAPVLSYKSLWERLHPTPGHR